MDSMGLLAQSVTALANEGDYYESVYALTPKQDVQNAQTVAPTMQSTVPVGPLVAYAPFIIFFALFIGAFGIQVINRALSIRRTVSALVIALFVASTPFVLSSVREGTRFRSNAGPAEIPKQVSVAPQGNLLQMTWYTDAETIGAVRIGIAPLHEEDAQVIIADGGVPKQDHTVLLGALKSGFVYEYEIYSANRWYDNDGQPLKLDVRSQQ